MNKEIWTAIIQPVLRENKGTATFVFTPKGTNHAWELIQSAKNNPAEWFVTIKTVADTDVFTREELEEIKRNTPEDLFNQEYNCEFLSGAGQAFRRIKENTHGLILEPTADHTYQIGVDLAKYQDFTVLTAIDLNTFEIAQQERFNQLDYNLQKAKIESFCLRWNRGKIWIDSTGV